MENNIILIKNSTLLSSFTKNEISKYLKNRNFDIKSYNTNNIIHLDGEICTKLELILQGKVTVDRIDKSGNLFTISNFEKDDVLGANLLFSKKSVYPMTVTSNANTLILEIKKEILFDLFLEKPDFLRSFLEYVSDHSSMLGDKIKRVVNKTIRESIINYLKHEKKNQNSNHIFLNSTKKALAEKMGVQRTSLSRELSKMKNEGFIDYDNKSITILTEDL